MLATWVAVRGEVEIREGQPQGVYAGYGGIEARLGSAAHGWRDAQVLSSNGESPIAGVGANGTAAVAWCRSLKPYGRLLYVSIAGPGRRFGPATLVSTHGRFAVSCPEALEVQPDGRVVLIWSQTLEYDLTLIKSRIQFALLRARGTRPVLGTISANVPGEGELHAAETEDGDVLVAFEVPTRLSDAQGVVQLEPGARRFTAPQAIELAGNATIRAESISAGPGGAALALTVRGEPAEDEYTDENTMAEQQPNGAFGPPTVIFRQPVLPLGDQFRPEDATVAFTAGGARVATWLNAFIGPPSELLEGEPIGPEVVVAAVRPAGATGFQAPVQLSVGSGRSGTPVIASVGAGTVVLWAQHEPGCRQRIYSAVGEVGTASARVLPLSGRYRAANGECSEGSGQIALAGSSAGAIAAWVQGSTLRITTTTGERIHPRGQSRSVLAASRRCLSSRAERSSYGIKRDHQRAGCEGGGLEPEAAVERYGAVIKCIHGDCAYGELVGGA
jgi:hypothetical protein